MDMAKLYGAGAFLAGLVLTLFLASVLTPRQWWRRPNARALLILVAGSWGIGSVILALAPTPSAWHASWLQATVRNLAANNGKNASDAAHATDTTTNPADAVRAPAVIPGAHDQPLTATAGQSFQTHRALHLRAAAGVNAPLLATVPPGATVTPTGARDGDWWQVRAMAANDGKVGWVSSLWLRRSGE